MPDVLLLSWFALACLSPGVCMSMLLDLGRIRSASERVDRVFEPAAFEPAGEDFRVIAPVDHEAEVQKDGRKFRLVGRRQHKLRPCLRLEAGAHQLAPDFGHQLGLGASGTCLEPFEYLRLPLRPHLQMAVALGVLLSGNVGRRGKPSLDQVEDFIVDPVELGAQCGEALQLFLGHLASRSCRFIVAAGYGSVYAQISGRP